MFKLATKSFKGITSSRVSQSKVTKSTSIKDFSTQGNVGNILGDSFERDLSQLFKRCGFKTLFFESHDDYDFDFYSIDMMQKNQMLREKGNLIGKIDFLLSGDIDSFKNLKDLCPDHHISEDLLSFFSEKVESEGLHILLIEAKLTSATLVKSINESSSPKNWWIESDMRHKNVSKAFVMNGGEESISFIKKTSIKKGSDEEKAWNFIEKNGISVFYFPSFSLQWVRDMVNKNKEMEITNKEIVSKNKEMEIKIKALEEFVGLKKSE